MTNSVHVLEENLLVEWLKQHYKNIAFITKRLKFEVRGRTDALEIAIKNLKDNTPLVDQKEEVAELWRNLIGKAIVYLKSEDHREKYHDDEDYGVEKLDEFFRAFRDFEPLLYGAEEERYRDHMAHSLAVFLIGEYLIRTVLRFNVIDVNDENLPEDCRVTGEEKEAMWCIISLTHDLGIALEKIPAINPKVEGMLEKFGVFDVQALSYPFLCLPLDDFAIKLISSDLEEVVKDENKDQKAKRFLTHAQSKYFLKFSEAYQRRDHGIISCLVLIKNLVFFLETDYTLDTWRPLRPIDAKQFLIRRCILRSIAAHNNVNIYYLRLIEFPFLLTICDELHERERPRFVDMFGKKAVKRSVTVQKLSANEIHYKVIFSWETARQLGDREKERMKAGVCNYFLDKFDKLSRILRSAVEGERRDLILTLEVENQLETPAKVYKLTHKTPEEVKITEDGTETSWLELSNKAT